MVTPRSSPLCVLGPLIAVHPFRRVVPPARVPVPRRPFQRLHQRERQMRRLPLGHREPPTARVDEQRAAGVFRGLLLGQRADGQRQAGE